MNSSRRGCCGHHTNNSLHCLVTFIILESKKTVSVNAEIDNYFIIPAGPIVKNERCIEFQKYYLNFGIHSGISAGIIEESFFFFHILIYYHKVRF